MNELKQIITLGFRKSELIEVVGELVPGTGVEPDGENPGVPPQYTQKRIYSDPKYVATSHALLLSAEGDTYEEALDALLVLIDEKYGTGEEAE